MLFSWWGEDPSEILHTVAFSSEDFCVCGHSAVYPTGKLPVNIKAVAGRWRHPLEYDSFSPWQHVLHKFVYTTRIATSIRVRHNGLDDDVGFAWPRSSCTRQHTDATIGASCCVLVLFFEKCDILPLLLLLLLLSCCIFLG